MSAILCGKRSAIFEDLPSSSSPSSSSASTPPVSKRSRCSSSSSPVRFSTSSSQSLLLHHLRSLFPHMDNQLLEQALEECGDDLDSAIRRLNELRLGGSVDKSLQSAHVPLDPNHQLPSQGEAKCDAEVAASKELVAEQNYPVSGAEWVELLVKEMMNASNMDDAKARASRVLEALEKSICMRASAKTDLNLNQENMVLKEQLEALIQENIILKRAICIQRERQKEYEDRNQELQNLKQLVSQYQEQLRTLEVNNYALTIHLKQAEQSSSIPGRFHPDVF
ncbi:hypothetical protein RIF29_07682 [Crotalaria pallida]|uniref:CUE domain-containing protein n=1 Tax=Crotalaria pallida TaxID=3830 RepID=A0AAN9J4E1_CROPI